MSLSGTRLHGQAVKTQPSHGCNRGSNPLGVTKKTRTLLRPCFFAVRIPVLRLALRPATGCTLARFALAVRRIPLESPSNQFRALFGARFLLGISPLFCVSFHDPQQAARSRAFALAVRRIPLESPSNQFRALFGARFLLGISPLFCVSFHDPQQAARSRAFALAVRRIPLESPTTTYERFYVRIFL